ncbi:hypothetical protein [Listeria ilorinensis]|uniref:hypothetical protein n=1 Tax=Listeria ilorinensis TaxID=2867439 RepID=UPI001EF638B8|nr:hypothetical protein [Listeria ilorinensis]
MKKQISGILKKKSTWAIAAVVAVIVVTISVSFYNRGRISESEFTDIYTGMSVEKVQEYVGAPKSKTTSSDEIIESLNTWTMVIASGANEVAGNAVLSDEDEDSIIEVKAAAQSGDDTEMYTYVVDGQKKEVYFVDREVVWKK